MVILSHHDKSLLAPHVPDDNYVPLMEVTLAGLRAMGDISLDVKVPGGKVTKPVSAAFEEKICEAYNDPNFIRQPQFERTYGSIKSFLDRQQPSPTLEFPDDMDESSFRFMTEEEFVSFHLIHDKSYNNSIPVMIMGIRRAARELDPRVVKEVKYDRRF